MIHVFLLTFNESFLLPHTIGHYRGLFPECRITIFDNFSEDGTREIAKDLGCEVVLFFTNDELSDETFLTIKNECWKGCGADWAIVCDTDEWLIVTPEDLEREAKAGVTILKTQYHQMIGEGQPIPEINKAVIYPESSKMLCFSPRDLREIGFDYGCHKAYPIGQIKFSENVYTIAHYKWLSLLWVLERHGKFGKRLSEKNIKLKLSFHYLFSNRKIKREYAKLLKQAFKVK